MRPLRPERSALASQADSLKALAPTDSPACTAACTSNAADALADPELARVAAAWPALPNAIKQAMLAIVASATGKPE